MYVVYRVACTTIVDHIGPNCNKRYKTLGAAKRAITMASKNDNQVELAALPEGEFSKIEHAVKRLNPMSGECYSEANNTPNCLSPSTDTYWSM